MVSVSRLNFGTETIKAPVKPPRRKEAWSSRRKTGAFSGQISRNACNNDNCSPNGGAFRNLVARKRHFVLMSFSGDIKDSRATGVIFPTIVKSTIEICSARSLVAFWASSFGLQFFGLANGTEVRAFWVGILCLRGKGEPYPFEGMFSNKFPHSMQVNTA
jgi:hypothetical protein